ncbi:MAG: hypothetical protein COZ77_01735 [Gallionellales bacterium CG_4_8_14_3_um_filter_54_18]|nr:MAG: hypothetical protein COZ77_01735 [Gallionellales bacterium CG_4_8_14_3_um_filter_54_18]
MKLAPFTTRRASLVSALETLAQRANPDEAAHSLLHELAGITVLVARKFTNDRTADGLLEAFYLTLGCVSLGIAQADIPHEEEAELAFLLQHDAEKVFQAGFRHIRELAGLPGHTLISDFDKDPVIQQRNLKALFVALCRADPGAAWTGDETYRNELRVRRDNQIILDCAKWLRKQHYAGPIKSAELDANAVIDIAIMFAILHDGRIVARTGQREIENLIRRARATPPDIEAGWNALLASAPPDYQALLQARMDELRNTLVKKILSKTTVKTVVVHIQRNFAGDEQEVDYA